MNYNSAFTGAEIDALLDSINVSDIDPNTDLNSITERGFYRIKNSTVFDTLINKPDTVGAASILIVIPFPANAQNTNRVIQIIICNQNSSMFIRIAGNNASGEWGVILRRPVSLTKMGTTAQRPDYPSNQTIWYRGDFYFDTTLGKPIWYTGDTSDGKSGWVDATGANV